MGLPGLTRVQADKRYAASGVPTYAGRRLNRYDPVRNVYNLKASNTRKFRAGLALAQAGTGIAEWAFVGDSESDNYQGPTDGFSPLTMWPYVMRNLLTGAGGAAFGGSGQVMAGFSIGSNADLRWTFSGGYSNQYAYAQVVGAGTMQFSTFVSGETGTSIVAYLYGNASVHTITVDGVAPADGTVTFAAAGTGSTGGGSYSGGTVTPSGNGMVKMTISGLLNTTHTLLATNTTGNLYYVSASVRKTAGLIAHKVAYYGAAADGANQWNDQSTNTKIGFVRRTVASSATGVFIALGPNDIIQNGASVATIIAALTTIRGYWASSDVILVAQYRPNAVSQANWESYISALYTLADTLDCPLLDLYDRSGGYTTANANGLMGDATHPNRAANRDWGTAAAALLETDADLTLATPRSGEAAPSDFGWTAWTFNPIMFSGSGTMTLGSGFFTKVYLRQTTVVSSITVCVGSAGASLTNVGFALYDSAGKGLTSSVNANGATAAAFQSTGYKTVTITPQTVTGPVYVLFWFTGTTAPGLVRQVPPATTSTGGLAAPNLPTGIAGTGLTTAAPSPMATQTTTTFAPFVALA